jgi:excisionase family DNA binding protein
MTSKATYSVSEVAEHLKCSASTVYELLYRKELRGFRIRRSWRITAEALAAFIAAGGSAYDQSR